MANLDVSKMLYPEECPKALQRWANSLLWQRVGDGEKPKRVAGWRWDGVSDEIVLVLAPGGTKMQRIAHNAWMGIQFPLGTLVVQDVYGGAVFKVVGYRRGNVRLRSEEAGTYHDADIRHLTKVGVAPPQDSEGNEDAQSLARRGRSAGGSVRPDPQSAAAGLGEEVPVAASSSTPRMSR
jgi:hypothetical protein